jgi:hypothetical protein
MCIINLVIRRWFALSVLFIVLSACSDQTSEPAATISPMESAVPAGVAAVDNNPEPEADAALLRSQPTNHWINDQPIGNNQGPVTIETLASGNTNPEQWLHYGGDYRNFRHSPVTALNPKSIQDLEVAWSMPTGTEGQFAMSPIVYDGIMYMTTSYNHLMALNAATGELYWRYDYPQPEDLRICCGPANRGAVRWTPIYWPSIDSVVNYCGILK